MTHSLRQLVAYALAAACLALSACSTKVLVPPRVDLSAYESIGIVEFTSNSHADLEGFATRSFMQTVQSAQPGARILELGDERRVLQAIGQEELDFEAIRAIGEKYRVDAVMTGHLEVTDVRPRVNLSTVLKSMKVAAEVEGGLSTKLLETRTGATVWTSSARGKESVAQVSVARNGPSNLGAGDRESAYGRLVRTLVTRVTPDFWARYEKQ